MADQSALGADGRGEPFVLDRHRAQERITLCCDGDAGRLWDRIRIAIPVDDARSVYAVLEDTVKAMRLEIVSIDDRFTDPAPDGHRDLQARVRRSAESDEIATLMIVYTGMLEAKRRCLPLEASMNANQSVLFASSPGPLVVVSDLFNYVRPNAKLCFAGFDSIQTATDFAKRRATDNIRYLHNTSLSRYLLRLKWLMYGEDVIVVQNDRTSGEPQPMYHSFDEVDALLRHGPWADAELDWWRTKEECRLDVSVLPCAW
jgi:hypothetical protein